MQEIIERGAYICRYSNVAHGELDGQNSPDARGIAPQRTAILQRTRERAQAENCGNMLQLIDLLVEHELEALCNAMGPDPGAR